MIVFACVTGIKGSMDEANTVPAAVAKPTYSPSRNSAAVAVKATEPVAV